MRPRDGRGAAATGRDLLAGGPIEVRSEPVELHARSASERSDGRFGADESMPTQRGKLADRNPVPGHDEGFALVKLAHDLAAVIAKLTLSDLSGHTPNVARVLHATRCPSPQTDEEWRHRSARSSRMAMNWCVSSSRLAPFGPGIAC